jgi:hypothetical protein
MRIIVIAILALLFTGCADVFPGDRITTPQHCTEISTPASLQESFKALLKPGEKVSFKSYSTEDTFAAVSASVQRDIKAMGYAFDPKFVLRKVDRGPNPAEYIVVFTKKASKYIVVVADLADLRSRGEQIEGTADFMVMCGVKDNVKKQVKKPGEKPSEGSPGYEEL